MNIALVGEGNRSSLIHCRASASVSCFPCTLTIVIRMIESTRHQLQTMFDVLLCLTVTTILIIISLHITP